MRRNIITTIFKKEVLDIFRDKRVIFSMIVIPLISFPLLLAGLTAFMQSQVEKVSRETFRISYTDDADLAMIKDVLKNADFEVNYFKTTNESYPALIKEKRVHFHIDYEKAAEETFTVYFDRSNTASDIKYGKLSKSINEYKDGRIKIELAKFNVPDNIFDIVKIKIVNIASEGKMKTMFLGMMLPYLLIILSVSGAAYPAVDLTVGEKERGTLETLLSSGATRREIVVGKYLTTVLVAVITALASLLSIVITFKMMPESSEFGAKIDFVTFLISLSAIVPITMIFSALTFAISTFSKSQKEAQSYIQPMMMFIIFPSMASFIPGFELNLKTALIPVFNISLLLKSIIMQEVKWLYFGITMGESVLLAAIFILLAFRLFDREGIIFKGE